MTEERRVQLVAEVDTTRTRAGFNEIGQQAGQMAQQVTRAGEQAERAVGDVGAGASTASRSVETAQRNIVQAIQRATIAMEAGGRQTSAYYELLARQRGVSPSALTPYLNQLRAIEQAQTRTGASTAQVANALRLVPAQLSDVAVQLAGGQSPVMVLMQQGSQLRDMFGSIPAAIRGVGTSIGGLVTPFTVVAAAVGGLAFAYKAGADESAALQRSLILSGNAAGATASQLGDVTRQVAALAHSRDAGDVVGQLVQTARVPADSLQRFAVAAIESQRLLGRSVQDTVQDFAELGRSPLAALTKIDDKYHFVTASTLFQVKALQDQGKASEAAAVAQEAYFKAVQDQKDKVSQTLNSWERAWNNIKKNVSDAANAVVDFVGGHDNTNAEKLAALAKERQALNADLERAKARGAARDGKSYDPSTDRNVLTIEAEIAANKRAVIAIQEKSKAESDAAKQQAEDAKKDQARKDLLGEADILLSRRALMVRDIGAVEQRVNESGLNAEEKKKALDIVKKKYYDVYLQDLDLSIGKLQQQLAIEDLISQRKKDQIQAQLDLGNITQQGAFQQTAQLDFDTIDRRIREKRAELAAISTKQDSAQEQNQIRSEIAQLQEERLTRQQQLTNDLARLEKQRADASRQLFQTGIVQATAERDSLIEQVQAQFEYNQEIGLSTTQVAELRAARLSNAAALKDETAASLEAIDPGSELAAKYREQAQALRDLGDAQVRGAYKDQMVTQWKQAVDQYGQVFQQGFADMLNNGQAGWQSFTKSLVTTFKTSVADQIYKMFARPIIVQLVGSYLGVSQAAIAGEIASQPNGYGITAGSGPIGAAQAASSLYSTVTGGMTLAGGLGTGFMGSLAGGLTGAGVGSGLTSSLGLSIGNGILDVVGPGISSALASGMGAIATALPWVGGAIAAVSLFKSAFGHGSTEVQGQGIRGTLSASGVSGQSYQNLHQDGGWFSSDRDWEKTTGFTEAMSKQFTNGLQSMETAAATFASSLGVQADWISTYTKSFDLKLTGDATKDQQIIADFFSGIGDEIANKLVPNLADFAKSGEAASATLERLAGDFKGTDQVAQLLGRSASVLFGATGIESAKARESLIDFSGGLSTLSSEASFFNQNFLTDAERIKPVAEALDKALGSLGLDTIPTTRDEFKGLINSLIDSGAAATDAGGKQLTSLLALAEAFAQVHPQIDAAADAASKAAKALQDMRDSASTLLGGVDNAFSALQKVVAREKTAVQASVTAQTAAVAKLQTLSQALRSTLDSLKSPDQKAAERASAQAQIRAALAIAKAGGALPTADSLQRALAAVTQDASDQFSSYADYLRDLYQTQNDITQLANITDDSLSVEQQSLDALQAQLTRLDDLVAQGQEQIDALKGQSVATLTLAQAMAGLQTAISGAQANPIVGATSGIANMYQQLLGRPADQAGLEYWQNAIAGGSTLDSIREEIMKSAEYKGLHPFAVGTNSVPEDMPAFIHKGERIIPAADNRALMARLASPSSNNDVLVAEVRALREAVAKQQAALEYIAQSTGRHADMFENATGGGGPLLVEVTQ